MVLDGLDAGCVVVLVHRVAQHVDVDGVKLDHAAPHAAALFVDHGRERLEHLGGVADVDSEADAHEILQSLAKVHQRDGVGLDARVRGHPVGGGVVGAAEGVELHEGVVASVHRGLELVEDAVSGIVEDVGRRAGRLFARIVGLVGGLGVGGSFDVVGFVVGLAVGGRLGVVRLVGGLVVGGWLGVVVLVGGLGGGSLSGVAGLGIRLGGVGNLATAGSGRESGADNKGDGEAQPRVGRLHHQLGEATN